MFKKTFLLTLMVASMMGNTMVGYGGLKVFDMSKEDQEAYILSRENPVTRVAASDQGNGYVKWIDIQDK